MRRKRIRRLLLALLILAALIAGELLRSNYLLVVSRYEVPSPKITSPFRVVFISDVHGREFGTDNCRLIEKIAAEEPDFIALVGDIFNSDADREEIDAMCRLIEACSRIAPVYYCLGNQEAAYNESHREPLNDRITAAGATILESSWLDLEIAGNAVRLGGYMGYYSQPHMLVSDKAQIKAEKQFTRDYENTERFKLLLNHIPTGWLDWSYRNKNNVDLVLSGHYHGGVVRIPILDRGLFAPYAGWFPPYTKGLVRGSLATCILSTGMAGSYGCPRFCNPPEICVVDVLPG